MQEIDEIDRAFVTDEPIHASPRLVANVMAEVRAMARPSPPTFPWREFSLTLASYGGLAAAAATVYTCVDPTVFAPVARELIGAGAAAGGVLATLHLRRQFE